MSNASFHLELLKNYQIVDRPGTFKVSVAYDVTDANLYVKDAYPRYIIPLRVILGENLFKLVEILDEYKTVPFEAIKTLFMSGAIFDDGELDVSMLPVKGEEIIATFEHKEGVLLCTHIKLIDREALYYVDLSKVSKFYKNVEKYLDK